MLDIIILLILRNDFVSELRFVSFLVRFADQLN